MSITSSDPLFLGLTRPTMFMGVTQSFFILNGMINLMLFLAIKSFLYPLILFPLLHGIGYLACLRDPMTFDLWFVFVRTCMKCKNKRFWNAQSYEVF